MDKLDRSLALILIGIGMGVLGFLFSKPKPQFSYAMRLDDLEIGGFPYSWVLAVAACTVLVGLYFRFARPN